MCPETQFTINTKKSRILMSSNLKSLRASSGILASSGISVAKGDLEPSHVTQLLTYLVEIVISPKRVLVKSKTR